MQEFIFAFIIYAFDLNACAWYELRMNISRMNQTFLLLL